MRMKWLVAACLCGATLWSPGVALAKGTSLEFGDGYVMPGETISARGQWVETFDDYNGTIRDGPYNVFMVPGEKAWRRETLSPRAIHVGTLHIGRRLQAHHSFAVAVSFRVPPVVPGPYFVEICNANCRLGFGDLEGGTITVVSSELEAQLRAQIERLQQARWDANRDAGRLAREINEVHGRSSVLDKQVGVLASEIAERDALIADRRSPSPDLLPWPVSAAAGLIALVLLGLLLRARRIRPDPRTFAPTRSKLVSRERQPVG